jgi:DNA-binding SARP family transcriptional activator
MLPLPLPGRRILAYLALQGQPVSRSTAVGQLWPDQPEQQGRANLRRALWQLPRGWVQAVGEELVLDAAVDLVDARLAAARSIAGGELAMAEIELLSEDLLPGWHEEWVTGAQDTFRLLRVQALEAACRSMAATGQHALATQAGFAALRAEPLRESAAEALICAHLIQGNRYEAARCFRAFARLLDEELGVLPNPALTDRLQGVDLDGHHPR